MRRRNLIFAVIFVFLIPILAWAQPVMPDLTGKKATVYPFNAILNGKNVNLELHEYEYSDPNVPLEANYVDVISTEAGQPWLAYYTVVAWDKLSDGNLVVKGIGRYFFEYVKNKWVLIKDFSASKKPNQDLNDLLKDKYKFTF